MAERQRGGMEFYYENGFFADVSDYEPLQLYRAAEHEQESGSVLLSDALSQDRNMLLYCVAGQGTACFDEYELPLAESMVVYHHGGGTCRLTVAPDASYIRYICLELHIGQSAPSHLLAPLYEYFREGTRLHMAQDTFQMPRLFTPFITELCGNHPMSLLVRDYLNQILVFSYRNFARRKPPQMMEEPTVNAVGHTTYAVIRYLDEHLYSMNTLMDMAKELGYSYNYLSHLFRRKTGMTIQTYVSHRKIERSRELLRNEKLSVTEIAATLNYDCIQSFSKAFKRITGLSPTEYREHCLQDSNFDREPE